MPNLTDRRYPLCSQYGLLRAPYFKRTGDKHLVVSTQAMYAALGWAKYREFLPHMRNKSAAGLDPKHVEDYLRGINGQHD
jgi:hypothetical protein